MQTFERLTTLSLLLLTMGFFAALFLGSDLHELTLDEVYTKPHPGLMFVEAVIYLAAFLFAIKFKLPRSLWTASWPFLVLVCLAAVSTAWSLDPIITLRRSGVLLGTTVCGLYLGARYTTEAMSRILLESFCFLSIVSIILLLLSPSLVLDASHTGALKGVTQHKNVMGEYMGLFLIQAVTYSFRRSWGTAQIACVITAASLLLASQSGTSILSALVTLLMLPTFVLARFTIKQALPLLTLALAAFVICGHALMDSATTMLALLGKDSTLTGRALIWQLVFDRIGHRPLLGYGFESFWQGFKGESLFVLAAAGWGVPHSHNGYLETLLGLGITGLTLVAISVLGLAYQAFIYLRRVPGLPGLWPAAFLTYFLIHAVTENSLLTRDGLPYMLLVILSTSLNMHRKVHKPSPYPTSLASLDHLHAGTGAAA
jgi:exopolysaccharide production protein ExoQ